MLRFILLVTSLFLVAACSGPGADSGFAPGSSTAPVVTPTTTSTNHIKHGQVVNMANGWKASYDDADPVEQKTLANGWKVEVKYE